MEYVQEQVTTLHDYGDATPSAPVDRTTVVVPLTERDHTSLAAERVFSHLETVDPQRVIVALRADERQVGAVCEWLESFDLTTTVLWCTAPRVEARLDELGLNGQAGKGRDLWLALGIASQSEYVVVHDADATTYDESHVPKLLFGLTDGYDFVKGYYARVENDQLYGRLWRLFYTPLVRALDAHHDEPLLDYLASFRYALAGEFATTGELARQLRTPRGWGLEVGTLGAAFDVAGFERTAQVDLGLHEHEHRSVGGPAGLGQMSTQVGQTLFNVLEDHGVQPEYTTLREEYRVCADRLIGQYGADAAFNGFEYDTDSEREQVDVYADTIERPQADDRLPAWEDVSLHPEEIAGLSAAAIEAIRHSPQPAPTER